MALPGDGCDYHDRRFYGLTASIAKTEEFFSGCLPYLGVFFAPVETPCASQCRRHARDRRVRT